MPIARVQTKKYGATSALATHTFSLDSTPTSGNIVVVCMYFRRQFTGTPRVTAANINFAVLVGGNHGDAICYIAVGFVRSSPSASISMSVTDSRAAAAVAAEYSITNPTIDVTCGDNANANPVGVDSSRASPVSRFDSALHIVAGAQTGSRTYSSPSNSFSIVDWMASSVGSNDGTALMMAKITTSAQAVWGLATANTGSDFGAAGVAIGEVVGGSAAVDPLGGGLVV